jgi:hypothetical protein
MRVKRIIAMSLSAVSLVVAWTAGQYGPGAGDTEIRIGNTMPYSGPASFYGENVLQQAASIHDMKLPMLLPGISVHTSADDFAPIKQMQLEKFDGTTFKLFGEVVSGS